MDGLGGRAIEHPVEGSLPRSLHQHVSSVQHCQDANNAVMARGDGRGSSCGMTGRVLSVALDWTGLCVVVGQGGACAYTPVNRLRGGRRPRACRLADTCREGSPGQRRRAAPARLLRRHAMPAAIPRTAAAARVQGERWAASAALAACSACWKTIVLSPGPYHGLSWAVVGW